MVLLDKIFFIDGNMALSDEVVSPKRWKFSITRTGCEISDKSSMTDLNLSSISPL